MIENYAKHTFKIDKEIKPLLMAMIEMDSYIKLIVEKIILRKRKKKFISQINKLYLARYELIISFFICALIFNYIIKL